MNNCEQGFSLIEFVVVIVILAIVAGATGPMLVQSARSTNVQYELANMDNAARTAVVRMARDLRNIRSNTTTDLSSMLSNGITFIEVNGDTINYSLGSGYIFRRVNLGTSAYMMENVTALNFSYYDANGAVTAVASQVRYIRFSFTVTTDTNNFTQTFGNTVYLRNSR